MPHGAVADVAPFQADLTRPGALADSVTGSDVVIYLVAHITGPGGWRASEDDAHAAGVNLGLVRDLVAALRDGRRSGPPPTVLFAGTVMQVGVPPNGRIDGTEPDAPGTACPRQKLAAERLLREATEEGVLRAVSLRLPTVYGHVSRAPEGGRDKGVVAMMIRRALRGEGVTMWGEGTVRRDLLHVDDVAAAVPAASPPPGRRRRLGAGRPPPPARRRRGDAGRHGGGGRASSRWRRPAGVRPGRRRRAPGQWAAARCSPRPWTPSGAATT
ncbi:NAD-dependent epimerase/dehydratase family protein [Streptomyces sp. NPDC007991]|uniref:NAD-dependent epimerase/dehydratase family protein n=1 Tax=Streptomyces sp. NPDC007991 TaxID=3364803 RepID=UPI0036F14659